MRKLHERLGGEGGAATSLRSRHRRRLISAINARERQVAAISDGEIRAAAKRLRETAAGSRNTRTRDTAPARDTARTRDTGTRFADAATRFADAGVGDALIVEAFALAREACRRATGLRLFDVQLEGALLIASGRIAEMQTGEGKTLAAVPAAFWWALSGRVHVLTANDYLARRDADWMGPAYELLGISVGCIQQGMTTSTRRRAYSADVTYATPNEAGFDFLRDRLAFSADEVVHQDLDGVIVDEIDSILIDEARVPLVVAGGEVGLPEDVERAAAVARSLRDGEHFTIDADRRRAALTFAGHEALEAESDPPPVPLVLQAIEASVLVSRDVHYIVRDGRIEIVDEFKGRTDPLRRWPDGFHCAVQAKEGVPLTPDGRILGQITLQSLVRLYRRRAGMTATARTSADEFQQTYGLEVEAVRPNRRCVRADEPDLIFATRAAKERALVEQIATAHATGRPVLVGTASVWESERVAELLAAGGVACTVLNARHDATEAAIVAEAGAMGAVTISTNMAGRGTDILLGGSRAATFARAEVAALGGLLVLGTNRHEARRVDLQLRGRAGRQGDPGTSRFLVSLEDPLFVRHRAADLLGTAERVHAGGDAPCTSRRVRREVEHAQRTIDVLNFHIRSHLDRLGSVVEAQRRDVQAWRDDVLSGRAPSRLEKATPIRYKSLVAELGPEAVARAEQQVTLACIDHGWSDHLAALRDLREGVFATTGPTDAMVAAFTKRAQAALAERLDQVRERISQVFERATITSGGVDLESAGIVRPTAKFTYLLSEVPGRGAIANWLELTSSLVRDGFRGFTREELAAQELHDELARDTHGKMPGTGSRASRGRARPA